MERFWLWWFDHPLITVPLALILIVVVGLPVVLACINYVEWIVRVMR